MSHPTLEAPSCHSLLGLGFFLSVPPTSLTSLLLPNSLLSLELKTSLPQHYQSRSSCPSVPQHLLIFGLTACWV